MYRGYYKAVETAVYILFNTKKAKSRADFRNLKFCLLSALRLCPWFSYNFNIQFPFIDDGFMPIIQS